MPILDISFFLLDNIPLGHFKLIYLNFFLKKNFSKFGIIDLKSDYIHLQNK
jgi:hypothetical protein